MNIKLEQYLINKFPKIYKDDISDQEPTKEFGFECRDGWFRLILWLSNYIQSYIDQQNKYAVKYPDKYLPVKQVKALQVKEKFATLRFYYEGGNERLDAIIAFAEYISGYVCEKTGKTNDVVVTQQGWHQTLNIKEVNSDDKIIHIDDEELRNILKETQLNL